MPLPAPTTPFTNAALLTEIQTDPLSLGYAAAFTSGGDLATANLINRASGAGSGPVWRIAIPSLQILQTIVSADYMALTSLQLQQLSIILQIGTFDATNANTGATFAAIFTGKPNTITAFTAMAQITGGRGQVLWGFAYVITAQQISDAKRGL